MSENVIDPVGVMESATIGTLADALAQAQGEFPAIGKDKTADVQGREGRQGYSYNYADLATVIAAVRPALTKNKLSFVQRTVWSEAGHFTLETRLMHASGEWMRCTYPIKTYDRPQDMGSALTYARRYSLTGLLGVASEEDDDGDAAQNGERTAQTRSRREAAARTVKDTGKPACPKCGSNKDVIHSKRGPGFYCFPCKNSWDPVADDAEFNPEAEKYAAQFD